MSTEVSFESQFLYEGQWMGTTQTSVSMIKQTPELSVSQVWSDVVVYLKCKYLMHGGLIKLKPNTHAWFCIVPVCLFDTTDPLSREALSFVILSFLILH